MKKLKTGVLTQTAEPINAVKTDLATVTVVAAKGKPLTKRFYVDEDGSVQRQNFGHAFHYRAKTFLVSGIHELSALIKTFSLKPQAALIRGIGTPGLVMPCQRLKENFPNTQTGRSGS